MAGGVPSRPFVSRLAGAQQRPVVRPHVGDLGGAGRGRAEDGASARDGADRAREAGGRRCGRRQGWRAGEDDGGRDSPPGGGFDVGFDVGSDAG